MKLSAKESAELYAARQAREREEQARKAALFDVLAARSCIWYKDKNKLFVYDDNGHEFRYEAPTLAEAIEAAMRAEGGAK